MRRSIKKILACLVIMGLLSGCQKVEDDHKNTKVVSQRQEKYKEKSIVIDRPISTNVMSDTSKNGEKMVIGATMATMDSPYLEAVITFMKEEANNEQVELELVYANWDAEVQNGQIQAFIDKKVSAIILNPINAKSMLPSLKLAQKANIPIINLNMKVDAISTEYITTYVGASMSEEAALAAKLVVEMLGDAGGKVGIIEGAPGSDPQIYRTQTFIEQLLPYPQVEVVSMGNGNWSRSKAYLVAYDMIAQNKDLDIIYAHDSNMAMGAIRAIKALKEERAIRVIGIGEEEEYWQAIREGALYGLITQSPHYEGKYSIRCAIEAAKGNNLRAWYKNPVEIVTLDNLLTYPFYFQEEQD